jgi:hypothetical protein
LCAIEEEKVHKDAKIEKKGGWEDEYQSRHTHKD